MTKGNYTKMNKGLDMMVIYRELGKMPGLKQLYTLDYFIDGINDRRKPKAKKEDNC